MNDKFLLAPSIINSAIGGTIAVVAIYPLDLVKTRLQTQTPGKDGKLQYSSIPNAFAQIYRQGGFIGLYRGLAVSIGFVTCELIVNFTGNDFFKSFLHPPEEVHLFKRLLATTLTGLIGAAFVTPLEFLKIQLQDEGDFLAKAQFYSFNLSPTKYKLTARQVIRNVVKNQGILGMYQGYILCVFRDVPFSIIYFNLFALLYDNAPKRQDGETTASWTLLAGVSSGTLSAYVTTPIDVVKTHLQTLHVHDIDMQCNGIIHCIKRIYTDEGITAFFRGAVCRMLVIAPFFGMAEMIYYFGVAESLLNKWKNK